VYSLLSAYTLAALTTPSTRSSHISDIIAFDRLRYQFWVLMQMK